MLNTRRLARHIAASAARALGGGQPAAADEMIRARSAAERAGAKVQQQTADAARTLTELGISRRDAAELLGLSHQRVQQLLEAS